MAKIPNEPRIKPNVEVVKGKIRFACNKYPDLWFGYKGKLLKFTNGIIDVDENDIGLINKIKSISAEHKISYPKPKEEPVKGGNNEA